MKIRFLSFVDLHGWSGGGELYLRELYGAAEHRGYDVSTVSVWPKPSTPATSRPDITVVADIGNLPSLQRRHRLMGHHHVPGSAWKRYEAAISDLASSFFVKVDNAYVDVCSQGYLQCAETAPDCERSGCIRQRTAEVYAAARCCYFLSPLHRDVIRDIVPIELERCGLIRPTLDPEPYLRARREVRSIENVFVGSVVPEKLGNILETVRPLTVVTAQPAVVPPDVDLRVGLTQAEVADTLGDSRRFVYRSNWPEPFGRVIAEATLAGCEFDVTGQVGALSFDADLSDPAFYRGAADEFWDDVMERYERE